MSLEEDMARRAAQAQAEATVSGSQPTPGAAASSSSAAPSSSTPVPQLVATATTNPAIPTDDDDEDAALQAALALSRTTGGEDVDMHDGDGKAAVGDHAKATEGGQASTAAGESMDEDIDEEEAIARAIQMSMQPQDEQKK